MLKSLVPLLLLVFVGTCLSACKGESSGGEPSGGPVLPPDQGLPLAISPSQISDGEVNQPYLVTISASGGFAPYSFSAISGMPPGLALNSAGSFGGVPTQAGNFTPRVRVQDSKGTQKTIDYMIKIVPTGMLPMITTASIPSATVNGAYAFPISVSGGVAPYQFSDDGNFPPNISLSNDGMISGVALSIGVFAVEIRVMDSLGSMTMRTLTLNVTATQAGPQIVTTALPAANSGQPYSFQLIAVSGTMPYAWSTFDMLPPGLSMNANGLISGTPTLSGIYSLQVTAVDANNTLGAAIINLTVN